VRELLDPIEDGFAADLATARGDREAIARVRVRFLGRKGELTAALKRLGTLSSDQRPAAGKALNELKARMQERLDSADAEAAVGLGAVEPDRGRLEATLPARLPWRGSLHPLTLVTRDLERIFRDMGYSVERGPEVEDDFHNFQALNIPPDHPARDDTDTFYVKGELLLRTHTSPVQIRTMATQAPPIRMICPGRAYRRDEIDATHAPMFHQLEALVVDRGISMADLKGTVDALWKRFFGEDVRTRFRPGYFPFVEPGCEYDVSCRVCGGTGCRTCKGSGWIELGGAGMVHPAVFEAVGIDPEIHTGFAFGLGIDRIAMMRYGIDDLRLMLENDSRFLAQFPA
jgi:phenylalanyl-tRNA synthetase alpha chain